METERPEDLPADLEQVLEETGALAGWMGYHPALQRDVLAWIESANTPTKRSKRIDDTARNAGKGVPPSEFQ